MAGNGPRVRQTRRPSGRAAKKPPSGEAESGAGAGVDIFGGPVIDPTENVLALVDAESRRQDGLRNAEAQLRDALRMADERYQNDMRAAEVKRRDDLAEQKAVSDQRIADMLAANMESRSTLLATQLDQRTSALGERTSELEKKQWETGGKTSVSDPAITDAITKLSITVEKLVVSAGESVGQKKGSDDTWKFIALAIGMFVGLVGVGFGIIGLIN